ncbi:hypothetical protein [Luteimonas salinilitoris]|uniref:Transposase IS200-like domain-containing protein n=1 Tax=Luteimonas salinilitoris TaxID=3237697 RepID=A0ABV4HVR1_9GAMM
MPYALMTNHVHLLVSPASEGAVSRMMQMLGRRYVADRLVTPHAAWLALDVDPASRGARYAAWVSEGVDAVETEEIRAHLVQGKVYGSQRFRRHIESLAGRCAELGPRGRPRLIQRANEPGTFWAAVQRHLTKTI